MSYRITGKTGEWELVMGLEIHAQVISKSKLFSGSSTEFGKAPNDNVSLVDAAMPGMLPVLNKAVVAQAVRTGLGLNSEINLTSVFERKNYFYPDLPQGYQISQFEFPIVGKGQITITLPDGSTKDIGITRLHLEQDAGKSLHDQHPQKTFVDLNRSGVALMEIVSEPELSSPDEVSAYVKKIRNIMRYLNTCDGNMEEGNLRADVNISVRKPGGALGTRCEIKNVNSIRFITQAIEYEANRQVEILESGGVIEQQTRLFDAATGTTRTLRSKEEAHDYRYFPDPDLLPLVLESEFVADIKKHLPELPDAKKSRYQTDLGLSAYDADVLTAEKPRADYFESAAVGRDAKLTASWVINELLGALNKSGLDLDQSPVSPTALGELVDLISDQTISGKIAKDVFADMLESGKSAKIIVSEKGMQQITDPAAIEKIVDEVMATNADKVAEYRSGKDKLFGFFVGQTLKVSGGKANPDLVNSILKEKLSA
jgi:aspartyl-tRNA(Asn)/glutamyl-tRNA(Gln) amidotransferase subunit B